MQKITFTPELVQGAGSDLYAVIVLNDQEPDIATAELWLADDYESLKDQFIKAKVKLGYVDEENENSDYAATLTQHYTELWASDDLCYQLLGKSHPTLDVPSYDGPLYTDVSRLRELQNSLGYLDLMTEQFRVVKNMKTKETDTDATALVLELAALNKRRTEIKEKLLKLR